jgi:diaphanous 2
VTAVFDVLTLTSIYEFVNTSKEQCEVLEGMYKKMTLLFQDTAKYFAFDPKKYTMEEYFTDVKTFIEAFNVSDHLQDC